MARSESVEPDDAKPVDRRQQLRLVLAGVVLAMGVWFALANTQDVKIHFWLASARSPIVVALAVAAACGALIGLLVGRRGRKPSA